MPPSPPAVSQRAPLSVLALSTILATTRAFQPPEWSAMTTAATRRDNSWGNSCLYRSSSNLPSRRGVAVASLAPDYLSSSSSSPSSTSYSEGRHCYVPPYGNTARTSIIVLGISPSDAASQFRGENPEKRRSGEKERAELFDFDQEGYNEPATQRKMRDYYAPRPPPSPQEKARPPPVAETSQASRDGFREPDEIAEEVLRNLSRPPPSPPPRNLSRPPPPSNERDEDERDDGFDLFEEDGRGAAASRSRSPTSPVLEDGGGNYWMNPAAVAAALPLRRDEDSGGRGRNRKKKEDEKGDWWDTKRQQEEKSYFDGDEEDYRRVPPPARSRSSFRSGAVPPPAPIKQLYDKLFWFGFDPDVTRPTDRTMFGGTRGKFNAMDLIKDREERQNGRRLRRSRVPVEGGGYRDDFEYAPVDDRYDDGNDYDDYMEDEEDEEYFDPRDEREEWFDDDQRPMPQPRAERPTPPLRDEYYLPSDIPVDGPSRSPRTRKNVNEADDYSDNARRDRGAPPGESRRERRRNNDSLGVDTMMGPGRMGGGNFPRSGGGGGRDRGRSRGPPPDPRANAYDRIIGVAPVDGVPVDEGDRRRKGYAYKYESDPAYDDELIADYEAVSRQAAVADRTRGGIDNGGENGAPSARGAEVARGPQRPSKSWEERSLEMDRVPPPGVAAWGPGGRVEGDPDARDEAARRAVERIRRATNFLETRKDRVLDAEEELIALKADVTFLERQLQKLRLDTPPEEDARMELGRLLRDLDYAGRDLRLARLERDEAAMAVAELEDKHWALLSSMEEGGSFALDGEVRNAMDANVLSEADDFMTGGKSE